MHVFVSKGNDDIGMYHVNLQMGDFIDYFGAVSLKTVRERNVS